MVVNLWPQFLYINRSVEVNTDSAEYFRVAHEAVLHLVGTSLARHEMPTRQKQRLDLRPAAPLASHLLSHSLVVVPHALHGGHRATPQTQIHLGVGTLVAPPMDGPFDLVFRESWLLRWRAARAPVVVQLSDYGQVGILGSGYRRVTPDATDRAARPVVGVSVVGRVRDGYVPDPDVSELVESIQA